MKDFAIESRLADLRNSTHARIEADAWAQNKIVTDYDFYKKNFSTLKLTFSSMGM